MRFRCVGHDPCYHRGPQFEDSVGQGDGSPVFEFEGVLLFVLHPYVAFLPRRGGVAGYPYLLHELLEEFMELRRHAFQYFIRDSVWPRCFVVR